MNKTELRTHYRAIRAQVSQSRRIKSAQAACKWMGKREKRGPILSYASFGSELDTGPLNTSLMEKGLLVLPRVEGNHLELYRVQAFAHLQKNLWGIWEPDPNQCRPISSAAISLVLVPALAFDSRGYRLGYGKGYYDRLLAQIPMHVETIGLGFREQSHPSLLPIEPHDIPLHCGYFS